MATATASTLRHVFFFLEKDAISRCADSSASAPSSSTSYTGTQDGSQILATTSTTCAPSSRSSSPGSLFSTSASTKSSAISLSPIAAEFVPTTKFCDVPSPTITQVYELRSAPGKGLGLFATQNISRGTRILCDEPLVRIVRNEMYLVWEQYCRLTSVQQKAYDALSFYERPGLNLEQAARTQLIDPNDDSYDTDDENDAIADQVRVMSIFSSNNFIIADNQFALFADCSRINHSCIPNVHHSYNPTLKKETVHAVRDIEAGEELCTNYLGSIAHYWTRAQRWESLRPNYGFTCQCPACSDRTGVFDAKHELLGMLIWGLQKYKDGVKSNHDHNGYFIPESADAALHQSEDVLRVLIEQSLFGPELIKAYRLASNLSLEVKNFSKAMEYAHDEAEVERNLMGTELEDLKKKGLASEIWVRHVEAQLRAMGQEVGQDMRQKTRRANKQNKKEKRANGEKPDGGKTTSGKIAGKQTLGETTGNAKAASAKATKTKTAGRESAAEGIAIKKPADAKAKDPKVADVKVTEPKATDEKATSAKVDDANFEGDKPEVNGSGSA